MRGERPHSSPGQPQGSRHHPSAAPALTMTPSRLRGRAVVIGGGGDPCGRPGGGTYALASLEHVSGREGGVGHVQELSNQSPRHPRAVQAPPPHNILHSRPYWSRASSSLIKERIRNNPRWNDKSGLEAIRDCMLVPRLSLNRTRKASSAR